MFMTNSSSIFPRVAYVKIVPMLILASSSPRRQFLLNFLGISFQVIPAEVDESIQDEENPKDYVLRLAHQKSLSIEPPPSSRSVVIAADTAVVDGNQILGKPASPQEARNMLQKLRGRSHYVYSGLSVRDTANDNVQTDLCVTEVQMRAYHDSEIDNYVASGDPLDKAGAYAIQNYNFNPVQKITGCYTNVVGLPLCHLIELLGNMGVNTPDEITRGCRTPHGYNCHLADKIQEFS
jgi:MAF protein